jgi:hypothetical protein
VTQTEWVAGKDQVFTFWIVDVKQSGTSPAATAHIAERIQIGSGKDVCGVGQLSPCVTQVEAIFCNGLHPLEPAMPPIDTPPVNALCIREG